MFDMYICICFLIDPKVWFIPNEHGMVTKTSDVGTVPCLVTNPKINVTLYEKSADTPVVGEYSPSSGFTAFLEDRTYYCKGELNGEERTSEMFYIFSIVGTIKAFNTIPSDFFLMMLANVLILCSCFAVVLFCVCLL